MRDRLMHSSALNQIVDETEHVFSLEASGCLLNNGYASILSSNTPDSAIIKSNILLSNYICGKVKKSPLAIMNGSIKQWYHIDKLTSLNTNTNFFNEELPIYIQHISNLSNKSVIHDKFLLSDIFAECPLENSKLLVLYAQMHRAAMRAPGKNIQYTYVDKGEIDLNNLTAFFTKYPEFKPHNIELNFIEYNGVEIIEHGVLPAQATGYIDYNYRATTPILHQLYQKEFNPTGQARQNMAKHIVENDEHKGENVIQDFIISRRQVETFKAAVTAYRERRQKRGEYYGCFFARFFTGMSKTVKTSAVDKVLLILDNVQNTTLSGAELAALREGELGSIMQQFEHNFALQPLFQKLHTTQNRENVRHASIMR